MKRFIHMLSIALMAVSLTLVSCGKDPVVDSNDPNTPNNPNIPEDPDHPRVATLARGTISDTGVSFDGEEVLHFIQVGCDFLIQGGTVRNGATYDRSAGVEVLYQEANTNDYYVQNLSHGDSVGPMQLYWQNNDLIYFNDNTMTRTEDGKWSTCIGFRFVGTDGATHYAYALVEIERDEQQDWLFVARWKEVFYETTPEQGVRVGDRSVN